MLIYIKYNISYKNKEGGKVKKFSVFLAVFIVLILLYNLLLFLASLFPSSLIENNVVESTDTLLRQGFLPHILNFADALNDNFTDSIMINTCYSIDNTDPIFSYMSR